MRALLSSTITALAAASLIACGPDTSSDNESGEGGLFEELAGDAGEEDAAPDTEDATGAPDAGSGDDGVSGDGGPDDGALDEEDEGDPPVPYLSDTINASVDGTTVRFRGATGSYRPDSDQTVVGGAHVIPDVGAESLAVLTEGNAAGHFVCGGNNILSYNARDSTGAAIAYSSRNLGSSCTVDIVEYGAEGELIRGWFDALLVGSNGLTLGMQGAFEVERLPDDE